MLQGVPKKGWFLFNDFYRPQYFRLDTDKYLVSFEKSGIFKCLECRIFNFSLKMLEE